MSHKEDIIFRDVRKVDKRPGHSARVTLPLTFTRNYLRGQKMVSIEITNDGKLVLTPAEHSEKIEA